jgi:hypothetical protein
MHVEMRGASFLIEPQNQDRQFVSGLTSKPLRRFLRFGLKTDGDGFLWFDLKTGGSGFPGLGLKTDSSGLVIYASKSPRRFLDLCIKIKHASVCRLRHKINGGKTMRDTRRDLMGCFNWKQVALEFPNLALRLAEA